MTITLPRLTPRIVLTAAVVAAVVAAIVWFAVASTGPQAGSEAGFRSALAPLDRQAAARRLATAAASGAPVGRLLVLTDQLLDVIHSASAGERRQRIDDAIYDLSGAGCAACIRELARARP